MWFRITRTISMNALDVKPVKKSFQQPYAVQTQTTHTHCQWTVTGVTRRCSCHSTVTTVLDTAPQRCYAITHTHGQTDVQSELLVTTSPASSTGQRHGTARQQQTIQTEFIYCTPATQFGVVWLTIPNICLIKLCCTPHSTYHRW